MPLVIRRSSCIGNADASLTCPWINRAARCCRRAAHRDARIARPGKKLSGWTSPSFDLSHSQRSLVRAEGSDAAGLRASL